MLQPLIDWLCSLPFVQWLMKLTPRFYTAFVEADRWQMYLKGLVVTFEITLVSIAMGLVLGLFVAMVRTAHDQQRPGRRSPLLGFVNLICKVYTTVIRGTPMMVQILIWAFVILRGERNKVMVGMIGMGVNAGAYISEIIRGGLMSVDAGQMEAGRSLGLNYIQTMRHIIIPQAVKNILPALANELVTMVKESSIVMALGMQDLMWGAKTVGTTTYVSLGPYVIAALIYFCINFPASKAIEAIERRMRRGDKR